MLSKGGLIMKCPIEFDLFYLTLLTREGVKPLSRWEKEFGSNEIKAVSDMGLRTKVVERLLVSGKRKKELIFSRQDSLLDVYIREFMERPVERSPQTIWLEGSLFGYPQCCVEQFVREGYVANGLDPDDQRILFHWACRNCSVTPRLLPYYRSAYQRAQELVNSPELCPLEGHRVSPLRRCFRQGLIAAASLAIFVAGCGHSRKSVVAEPTTDVHWLSVEGDLDKDGLADHLEPSFNLDPQKADTDRDGVPDGVQLAKEMWGAIMALPREVRDDGPYVLEHLERGVETCEKCGTSINMGYVEIVNPMKDLSIGIPLVGLHYMEHGCFLYDGSIHDGGVDVKLLSRVLN